MLERVDAMSPMPAYEQVAAQLRVLIDDGTFPPGRALLPERALAEVFGVGKDCLRDGLRLLVAEGRITTARGRLAQVRGPAADVHELPLARGDRVRVRMPSRSEARHHRIQAGVPLIDVQHRDGGVDSYPADRFVIQL